jgi:hypothetical protein
VADQRRYGEDEVSEIFALATRTDSTRPTPIASPDGLTLEELQEVGREVGLSPEVVSEAVGMLDARGTILPRSTSLGSPVSVGRVVSLPRAATEREWEILVTELRDTFAARGHVTSQGGMREWRNGKLRASLEPTETGHRLRMGTHKTDGKAVNAIGVAGLVIGSALLVSNGLDAITFGETLATLIPSVIAASGGSLLAANMVRLRQWASEREGQMEHIAARARALLQGPRSEE